MYSCIKSTKSQVRLTYTVSLSNSVHISRVTWHVPGNWEVNREKILRALRNLVTTMNANGLMHSADSPFSPMLVNI